MPYLDTNGLTRLWNKIKTYVGSHHDTTKADQEDLQNLWDIDKGNTWEYGEQGTTPAYSQEVLNDIRPASINMIGGKTIVSGGTLINADVVNVKSVNADATVIDQFPISATVRNMCPMYGSSAGTAYNYIDFENKIYHQRVGSVDLGTLTWDRIEVDDAGIYNFRAPAIGAKLVPNDVVVNFLCASYQTVTTNQITHTGADDSIGLRYEDVDGIRIQDASYSDTTAFKNAMNGVILYYELATEITVDLSSVLTDDHTIEVEAGGSLIFENSHGYEISIPNETQYAIKKSVLSADHATAADAHSSLFSAKQDALPSVINDRYLHTNASTGNLEWSESPGGVSLPVSIANGGTGATTAAAARTNLSVQQSESFNSNSTTKNQYILIKIKSTTSWMLNFTLKLYQDYAASDVQISGYNYGTNYWHAPKAVMLGCTSGIDHIDVKFGYTSAWNLWVAVPAGNYTGALVCNICNGYTFVADSEDLFEITRVSSLPGTTQVTTSAYSNHPIGSIYISYSSTSPASLFGGSWTQITGRFLRAANDTSIGGSDTHSHGSDTTRNGNLSAAIGAGLGNPSQLAYNAANELCDVWGTSTYTVVGTNIGSTNFSHWTQVWGTTARSSVLPSYQDVYVWRRTA